MRPISVGQVMSRELVTMAPTDGLVVLRDRMHDHQIRHILVTDQDGVLVGLVSHRDLLRSTLIERPGVSGYVEDSILEEMRVEDVMKTELDVAAPEMDLRDAARLMLKNKYGCLPVIEDECLVGILTEADFMRVVLYED